LVDAAADDSMFPDLGAPWQITKLYAPVFTTDRITALHNAMLDTVGESPFALWIERMGSFEQPERQVTKVDVTGFVDLGRDALRAHRTQVDPDGFWFAVPTEIVESVYPWEDFELLYSGVGWSEGEDDLFFGM
jgi:mycothiol S-conjugate amidase